MARDNNYLWLFWVSSSEEMYVLMLCVSVCVFVYLSAEVWICCKMEIPVPLPLVRRTQSRNQLQWMSSMTWSTMTAVERRRVSHCTPCA